MPLILWVNALGKKSEVQVRRAVANIFDRDSDAGTLDIISK